MTREQMIDVAVQRTTTPIIRLFLENLLSRPFWQPMEVDLYRPIRREFARIMSGNR